MFYQIIPYPWHKLSNLLIKNETVNPNSSNIKSTWDHLFNRFKDLGTSNKEEWVRRWCKEDYSAVECLCQCYRQISYLQTSPTCNTYILLSLYLRNMNFKSKSQLVQWAYQYVKSRIGHDLSKNQWEEMKHKFSLQFLRLKSYEN